ncbi:MAG: hypothetical protein ABF689_13985 [Gluconobacter cerinus]|uniref:hypothetical protein n=1 Tax=Gluconobacter cerinus TaxID=38307 RepID=UPI000416AD9B
MLYKQPLVQPGTIAGDCIGRLRLSSMTAPFLHDGPMHGAVFQVYVKQVLVQH